MTDSLGKQVGNVMVRSINMAYTDGRADARVEIEEKVDNIPVRIRSGIELIPKAEVMRIIHDLDGYSDGPTT